MLAEDDAMIIILCILLIISIATYSDLHENVFLQLLASLARHCIVLILRMLVYVLDQKINEDVLV